ncbi:Elongation factor P--(R)-beta-lysine ligase [Buchnera aphidicola (Eriosoma lanigerum)]|uniref:elongation factor P--(R)-beta-lysine ligase n=1 Tax=Buchnera aphidicola TaxID=9 RepID=UPI003463D52B
MKKINNWKPTAKNINLIKRAEIINKIRSFFYNLNILEVDTPILSQFRVSEVYLESFITYFNKTNNAASTLLHLWLTTSPEYYMKRLISSHIGPIYQICHSFRNNEIGKNHHPEFTMLEWYRPFYNMYDLIEEVELFLKMIFCVSHVKRFSYQNIFFRYLQIKPTIKNYIKLINKSQILGVDNLVLLNKDGTTNFNSLLEVLFLFGVEPYIGHVYPTIIYHYPAIQAGNATLNNLNSNVADRFEVFFKGLEIGNGCQELTDYYEQKKRFEHDNIERMNLGYQIYPIDTKFLYSLLQNIPNYSGVAIGLDRVIMILLKCNHIKDVISFSLHDSV